MKRNIKRLILILVLSLFTYLIYKVVTKVQEKTTIANQIKTLPQFSFTTLENNIFSNTNLKPNTAIVLIYFNSECNFCQHEAQKISEHIEQLNKVQILFVSIESIETIKEFAIHYKLLNKQNITFLHDKTSYFSSQLDIKTVPTTLIYNKHKELLKKHKGQITTKSILNVLKE